METPETDNDSKKFSADYVREIREEAKSYRLQLEELRKEVKTHQEAAKQAQDAAAKSAQDAEARIAEYAKNIEVSRYEADLKVEAVKAGILDTEFLKLVELDTSKNAAEAVAEFAANKPFCFNTAVKTTVPTAPEPQRASNERKSLKDMSPTERAEDLKSYLGS